MKEVSGESTQESLTRALDSERTRNAVRLGWVRFLAVSAIFSVTLYLGFYRELADWAIYSTPFAAYWAITAVVLGGIYHFKWMEHWAGLTLALVDVPAIFWLQSLSLPLSPSPGGVAGFTLGIYVCLILLSALSLRRMVTVVVTAAAAVAEVRLQAQAGIAMGAQVAALVVLAASAAGASHLLLRIRALLTAVTREELKRARLG
ncbi:MAG TPA: adenylate/guanylate cyclase domain-containing protein, partial [Hyalangium sp.]|nr:adenylate/guanylate cyclase domain-containing protein [Hyalangium sp.]